MVKARLAQPGQTKLSQAEADPSQAKSVNLAELALFFQSLNTKFYFYKKKFSYEKILVKKIISKMSGPFYTVIEKSG